MDKGWEKTFETKFKKEIKIVNEWIKYNQKSMGIKNPIGWKKTNYAPKDIFDFVCLVKFINDRNKKFAEQRKLRDGLK